MYISTQSLEGVGHGLVLGHVDESSSQAEMREDEKHLLQDPVHLIQMLNRNHREHEKSITSLLLLSRADQWSVYLVNKQLQHEGGDAAVDPDEEVDGGQHHVGRARDGEHEGCWVHQRGDGPSERKTRSFNTVITRTIDHPSGGTPEGRWTT